MKEVDRSTTDSLRAKFEKKIPFCPQNEYSPTPLDPYQAYEAGVPYVQSAGLRLEHRALEYKNTFNLPDEIYDIAEQELLAAHDVRCVRNRASLTRLLDAIDWKTADIELLAIIDKARQAAADPQELLRLIKEYPDMVSVEFFKGHSMFDIFQYDRIDKDLEEILEKLQKSFRDAEVVLLDKEARSASRSSFLANRRHILVWKEKVGDARAQDCHVEIIVKRSMLMMSTDKLRMPHIVIDANNQGMTYRALPLGTSAYFRSSDYKDRIRTLQPVLKTNLGRIALDDPIAPRLSGPSQQAYLETLEAAKRRLQGQ